MILAALAMSVCPPPPAVRVTCVHDGDSLVINREKIRLADIDAPELDGRCQRERVMAIRARNRLVVLLNAGPVTVERQGRDKYRRTLARLGNVGEALIAEKLATRWPVRRDWCGEKR